jgi:hypothetical protein
MDPADFPAAKDGFVITHFLVVSDQDRFSTAVRCDLTSGFDP